MSYLIPTWDMTIEERRRHRQGVIEALARAFETRPASNFVTRQLLSRDMDLPSWRTPPLPSGCAYWIDRRLFPNQWVVIYGVALPGKSSTLAYLRIEKGGRTDVRGKANSILACDLDELHTAIPMLKDHDLMLGLKEGDYDLRKIRMIGYFNQALLFEPQSLIRVFVGVPDATDGERVMLLGFVAEPEGQTIVGG